MNIDLSYIELNYIRLAIRNEFDNTVELMKLYAEIGYLPSYLDRKYNVLESLLEKIEQTILSQ